ncbi:hypothetical protein DPMN_164816 [Dreissena polymorpha]|uniref:YqaJ viral recombinase domain-containing protein n=1 Tax=Dreissena polymorpha TaxID=45954 RepID=A0A9D4EZG0_DREPO|nr:hypothetical protein DPMN_164816 [Dreissena polymorpha]
MEDTVDIAKHEKYHQLKSYIPGENPKTTKQKSETWFKIRNRSSVTGSTCYTALGQGKLKNMQVHYDRVKTGIDNFQFTEALISNMNYGTSHEIDAIATVVARVLPSMFSDLDYFEEVCTPIPEAHNSLFMVVSPDCSLRVSQTNCPKMMFETKCKVENTYSTPVCYEIPRYYIPQVLCEMACCDCDELRYACYVLEQYFNNGILSNV